MNELIFTEEDYSSLRTRLYDSKFESCAILSTSVVELPHAVRLLVRRINIAPPDGYRKRNTSSAILEPSFLAPIVKDARKHGNGLVFVHTHPWELGVPDFSTVDSKGEQILQEFLHGRGVIGPNAALVFGENHCKARLLGTDTGVSVLTIGATRRVIYDYTRKVDIHLAHDRQVRLLGADAQRKLHKMVIGVVGVGGTGSVIVQQLAHLGVENFILIDHDLVEETNLNRLVAAQHKDVGTPKVLIAERQAKQIIPSAQVTTIQGSVLDLDVANSLVSVDFIFCCTDTQASRAVVNQLAYQYLVPCIDMGVSITTGDGTIQRITGRVQLLSPGHACLTCQELLDSNIVRQEFMTPEQRDQDPYFIGQGEPQPAVISLNSTMSSLATTMFLAVVAELPSKARQLNYDALIGRIRASSAIRHPTCVVCSRYGALGRGNEWPLPVRKVLSDDTQT